MLALTEGKWKGGTGAVKKQKGSKRPIAPPAPAPSVSCQHK
jgi:hypothetical protein